MSTIEGTITIRLEGRPTKGGRTYVTSPDLQGFHFLLEADADPVEAMEPTLRVFIERYLEAEVGAIHSAMNPRDYRMRQLDAPWLDRGIPHTLVTAVA